MAETVRGQAVKGSTEAELAILTPPERLQRTVRHPDEGVTVTT